jgi:hypothetical protein
LELLFFIKKSGVQTNKDYLLNPDFAIENLLQAEFPANTGTAKSAFVNISSIFLFTVWMIRFQRKILRQ